MKKIIALFVVLLVVVFGLVACGGNDPIDDDIEGNEYSLWDVYTKPTINSVDVSSLTFVNPGKLTVSCSTDYAPYEFVDNTKKDQDKFVGADIALAKAIAEAFGLELYIKPMDFDSTLIALDNNIVDVAISGFSYTEDRAASYAFSKCYYDEGDGGQVLLIKKTDCDKYKTIESMNVEGLKIAAQNGALQQDLVIEFNPKATLVKIDDLNSAYEQLKAGALDGICVAQTVAESLILTDSSFAIVEEPYNFNETGSFALVKKGNTALVDALNKVIDQTNAIKGTNDKAIYYTWIDESNDLKTKLGDDAGELIPEEE